MITANDTGIAMPRVFISYHRHKRATVESLAGYLEASGCEVWFDKELEGGEPWWDGILNRIQACDVFLYALTKRSFQSEPCSKEYNYAKSLDKHILPLDLDQDLSPDLSTDSLADIQWLEYDPEDTNSVLRLIARIRDLSAAPPLPNPLPESPPAPVSVVRRLSRLIRSEQELPLVEQRGLLQELKRALSVPEHKESAPRLLQELRQREDCYATIRDEIDQLPGVTEQVNEARPRSNPNVVKEEEAPVANGQEPFATEEVAEDSRGSERRIGQREPPSQVRIRMYPCDESGISSLLPALREWLEFEQFDTQTMNTGDGKTLLQVSKRGGWRKFAGMSTALNILLEHNKKSLSVEIGAGSWTDKAAAGAGGLIVFWPLAVTAAIGAWDQMKMPEKVFAFIEDHLRTGKRAE